LLLRLPRFRQSLWFDEIWSTRVMLDSVASTVRMLSADLHPPLFNVLMFVWIRIFGDSEMSVRMPSLVCGLITIALTAQLAIDYGWRRAAPAAALVLAISPAHIWYSQEARPYSFLLMLVVASVVVVHRIRETHARRWYVAYAVLAACMVFTQYFAAVYVAIVMLLALEDPQSRVRIWAIGVSLAIVLLVFLAVKWRWGFIPTAAGYLRRFNFADLWRLFQWMLIGGVLQALGQRLPAIGSLALGVQMAVLILMVRGLITSRAPGELAMLLLGLPLLLLAIGFFGAERFYIERSALTVLPFFALAIGIGAMSLPRPSLRISAVAMIVLFGALVVGNYFARPDEWTVYKPKLDWRATANRLAAEQSRIGGPVIVVSMGPALELRYYNAGFGPAALDPPAPSPSRGAVREWLKRLFAPTVDPQRGTTGRIYEVYAPDPSFVTRVFDREGTNELFLIRTGMTLNWSDRLIAMLQANRLMSVEPIFEAGGLRVLRVRALARD
jgi:4-amino-4-deoxy-L-arabinose transferase-like glycosyltransferase